MVLKQRERRGHIAVAKLTFGDFEKEEREREDHIAVQYLNFDHIRLGKDRADRHGPNVWVFEIRKKKKTYVNGVGYFETEKLIFERERGDKGKKTTRSRRQGIYTPCPDRHARHETSHT